MTFEAYYGITGSTATIHLTGELPERRVPALRGLVEQALQRPLNRLVLRVHGLRSICAGGVRCLAHTQQLLPRGAQITVDGAGTAVRRALTAAGLDTAMTLTDDPTHTTGPAGA
ncbi:MULTISPECIES: STAS domain-containing protein [Kitasatospora]|uniref:Putative antagonist protein n=1 Tax=Kitasatospora setae (strain ATCC 33774 / DSM 43861 / JCM 3304 / KCC A-0304 / NBRC 14216 / KM-6054) TaxID=452652 RepID=E4N417_KITSK|nr:STAS domain-containing protein [Kitasatospora setae]BAJ25948.1 putative antagonist protein [Kitasatospora setae KM-6054]BAJ33330.1 putative antagonist protein [Kitasatospora setae KM-6054]